MNVVRELLKISKEMISFRLGDEGWLLPDGTFLEVQIFQGHAQLVIEKYMFDHLNLKGPVADMVYSEVSTDLKKWKKAGLPASDFSCFSPSGYDPEKYAFGLGWVRINEGGVELPNQQAFNLARTFLSKNGNARKGEKIFVDIYRGSSYRTSLGELLEANSLHDLLRV